MHGSPPAAALGLALTFNVLLRRSMRNTPPHTTPSTTPHTTPNTTPHTTPNTTPNAALPLTQHPSAAVRPPQGAPDGIGQRWGRAYEAWGSNSGVWGQ